MYPQGRLNFKRLTRQCIDKDATQLKYAYIVSVRQNGTAALEISLIELKKVKHFLPYDLAIPLLGILPRQMKAHGHTSMFIQMFVIAIFIIAPSNSKCSANGALPLKSKIVANY